MKKRLMLSFCAVAVSISINAQIDTTQLVQEIAQLEAIQKQTLTDLQLAEEIYQLRKQRNEIGKAIKQRNDYLIQARAIKKD